MSKRWTPEQLLRYWQECHGSLTDQQSERFLKRAEVQHLLNFPVRLLKEVLKKYQYLEHALDAASEIGTDVAEKRAKGVHLKSEELNTISDRTGTYRCVDCKGWKPLHEFEYQYDGKTKVARRCIACRRQRRRWRV